MTASAQGRDVSAYQAPLTLAVLSGLDFAYTKVTDGLTITDPDLGNNWAVLGRWGKPRGGYHELTGGASASAQADFFVAALRSHGGLKPGDILAVVASDYPGVTDASVREWCDEVRRLVGMYHPILAYTDLSVAKTLTVTSEHYDLWVAWPNSTAPGPPQWAPARWKTWRFWQWGITAGVDADAYNGTAADLTAWIATYQPKPAPPAPAANPPIMEDDMPAGVIEVAEGVRESHTWPAGTVKQIVVYSDWVGLQTSAPVVDLRIGHMSSAPFDAGSVKFTGNTATYDIGTDADCNGCAFTRRDGGPATVAFHTN